MSRQNSLERILKITGVHLYGNDFHVARANYFTHYKTRKHEKKGDQCRNHNHVARPKYFTFTRPVKKGDQGFSSEGRESKL